METSQADVTSVKVRSFQSQIFPSSLRFHQLYAYVSLFSSTSNFLSNDVGCEHILIGRCEEKESWAIEAKQREKEAEATSGARETERKEKDNEFLQRTTSGQYGGGKGNSLHWNDFPNLECAAYIPMRLYGYGLSFFSSFTNESW